MGATGIIVACIILILILVLLRGKSSLAARVGANALIGAMVGPLATLAAWLFLAAIPGSNFTLRSPDAIGRAVLAFVLFMMAFLGGLTGLAAGVLDRGVRVVTFWGLVRVFLAGFAGVFLGALASPLGLVVIPLATIGLYVGMSAATTRLPDSDQPSWWPKPPLGWSPGQGPARPVPTRTVTQSEGRRSPMSAIAMFGTLIVLPLALIILPLAMRGLFVLRGFNMIAALIVLPLALILLRGERSLVARICANAVIGTVAAVLWPLYGAALGAMITGSTFGPSMGMAQLVGVLSGAAFMGFVMGLLVGALGKGVSVVTLWDCVRVFLGGFAGMALGLLLAGLLGGWQRHEPPALALLVPIGILVGMITSTTRSPEADQATQRS